MQTTEEWVEERLCEYCDNPNLTIETMFLRTHNTIKMYLENPDSHLAKGLIEACVHHNQLFMDKIGLK